MTLPLPWGDLHDPQVRENFEKVAQQFPIGSLNLTTEVPRLAVAGARVVAAGSGACAWTASQFSATTTVTHGMTVNGAGVTPVSVVATFDSGTGNFPFATWLNKGATTFQVRGWNPAAITATLTFNWWAFG